VASKSLRTYHSQVLWSYYATVIGLLLDHPQISNLVFKMLIQYEEICWRSHIDQE